MAQDIAKNENTPFPSEQARDLIGFSRLPEAYEKSLANSDQKGAWKGNHAPSNSAAYDAMQAEASDNLRDTLKVVQFDNTTAVIGYDPQTHQAFIAFDPTSARDNVELNRDELDNLARSPTEHSLGGNVHKGLYRDMVAESSAGDDSLIDKVSAILHEHAYNKPEPLQVSFTGFSKGGSQSALAAAEMIENGLFDKGNGMTLNNVVLFGTPAYGDQEFIKTFNGKAQDLGADVWTVELHGDAVPTVLTPEGSNYFTRYDYGQVGDRAYIDAERNVITNPDEDTLRSLRAQSSDAESTHNSNAYAEAMNEINASNTPSPEASQDISNPATSTPTLLKP